MNSKKLSNNILILLYSVLFFVTAHSALSLDASPQTQEVRVFTTSTVNAFINITNTLNSTAYFVTMKSSNSDISFVDNFFNLTAGETREAKITIDTQTSYTQEETIQLYFFEKQTVQLQPTTEIVHINNINYNPSNISILYGSTIRFINDDTIKHSITSSLFDQDLNPGQEFVYTFNNAIQTNRLQYSDKYTNYKGEITFSEVTAEEYVHNPNFDTSFKIIIKSFNIETEAELLFVDSTNFTVKVGESIESVFILKNIGNTSITFARFQSSPTWISFSRENLIVKPNEQLYVPFSIFPLITQSNETGKTYPITITVKGDNILDRMYNISVFIPFQENVNTSNIFTRINQTISEDFAIILFNTICKANPDYSVCVPQIIEKIVYKSPTLTFNITQERFEELQRKILESEQEQKKGYANILEKVGNIEKNSELSSANSAETVVLARKLDIDTVKTQNDVNNLFIFFIVLASIFGVILFITMIFLLIKKITFNNREFKT